MRPFLSLLFGVLLGATAVLVYFTVDTDFDPDTPDDGGVGNVRLEFHREALEILIAEQLQGVEGVPGDPSVAVVVREEGLLEIELGVGAGSVGVRGTVVVNPEVVEGRLVLEVVEARVGQLPAPEAVVPRLEEALGRAIANIGDGREYRLVAIITRDGVLAFEVEI